MRQWAAKAHPIRARLDLSGVDRCANAGGDGASNNGATVQGDRLVGNCDERVLVDNNLLREETEGSHHTDLLAAKLGPEGTVGSTATGELGALAVSGLSSLAPKIGRKSASHRHV